MFNLPDPNWLIDNRSDLSRHNERSDRFKKATASRRINMFQPAEQCDEVETPVIPGTFLAVLMESRLSQFEITTGCEMEVTALLMSKPLQLLTYSQFSSDYEGPHALIQQIHREVHEVAP